MDPGLRTPLIDFFRRGEAAREERLLAARGAMASPPRERLALLMLLTRDPDAEVATTANATLDALPAEALAAFLSRADVPGELREFFAARGVRPAAAGGEQPGGPAGPGSQAPGAEQALDDDGEPVEGEGETDPKVLSSLSIVARMKLAMKGTREQRAQLIRDSNRMVSTAVLSSPKLTEAEVEAFTKMGNVSEEVLRIIGMNRNWVKNYGVVIGLVKNPKTPPGISMQMLHRVSEKDIKMLAVDRNVPEALRLLARKMSVKSVK